MLRTEEFTLKALAGLHSGAFNIFIYVSDLLYFICWFKFISFIGDTERFSTVEYQIRINRIDMI